MSNDRYIAPHSRKHILLPVCLRVELSKPTDAVDIVAEQVHQSSLETRSWRGPDKRLKKKSPACGRGSLTNRCAIVNARFQARQLKLPCSRRPPQLRKTTSFRARRR